MGRWPDTILIHRTWNAMDTSGLESFFFHWEQSKNPNVPELYGNKKEQEVKTCKNLGFHSGQIFPPIH